MAIVSSANFLFFTLLLCSSIAAYGVDVPTAPSLKTQPHSPPPPPAKPPTPPPTPPPSHPPVKPPAHPPVKPPAHPPVKPPAHPPVKPPAHPPVKPPAHPPIKAPAHPPVKPPAYPLPRKKVAVQGVVFCKSCKFRANDTVLGVGATPIVGAAVRLQCNNTKYPLVEQAKTDKNGYFVFLPQKLTTSGYHKCKVSLVSSPLPRCSAPTNLHSGVDGALLIPAPFNKTLPYQYYNVGPFAFAPHKKLPCHY